LNLKPSSTCPINLAMYGSTATAISSEGTLKAKKIIQVNQFVSLLEGIIFISI
jgi:hypothetical protein